MTIATTVRTGTTRTGLYHELRGSGKAVLLISGATGDAGHFTRTAEQLADEFTVITYDRRGNSRSRTSGDADAIARMSAQADDAAAIINDCGFDQAVVFGTSGGAVVALELLARQPRLVKGAALHEPPLLALLPPQPGPDPLDPLASILTLARTDPRAALEAFVKLNSSASAWAAIDPATRDRMLGNAVTLFAHEFEEFVTYRPDEDRLRMVGVPVALLRSRDGLPFEPEVLARLEPLLGVRASILSGHHAPYLDTPEVFAEELRPILRTLWRP